MAHPGEEGEGASERAGGPCLFLWLKPPNGLGAGSGGQLNGAGVGH